VACAYASSPSLLFSDDSRLLVAADLLSVSLSLLVSLSFRPCLIHRLRIVSTVADSFSFRMSVAQLLQLSELGYRGFIHRFRTRDHIHLVPVPAGFFLTSMRSSSRSRFIFIRLGQPDFLLSGTFRVPLCYSCRLAHLRGHSGCLVLLVFLVR